ncbi:hypothetical protein T492DRAFT_977562 [Pavlovales sp. CCMP2436]|nr:hypothetical protein T492DRAFT_977562 [Pavlovales sp. CCMP2436]
MITNFSIMSNNKSIIVIIAITPADCIPVTIMMTTFNVNNDKSVTIIIAITPDGCIPVPIMILLLKIINQQQ